MVKMDEHVLLLTAPPDDTAVPTEAHIDAGVLRHPIDFQGSKARGKSASPIGDH
jgi:hypothetical protein